MATSSILEDRRLKCIWKLSLPSRAMPRYFISFFTSVRSTYTLSQDCGGRCVLGSPWNQTASVFWVTTSNPSPWILVIMAATAVSLSLSVRIHLLPPRWWGRSRWFLLYPRRDRYFENLVILDVPHGRTENRSLWVATCNTPTNLGTVFDGVSYFSF